MDGEQDTGQQYSKLDGPQPKKARPKQMDAQQFANSEMQAKGMQNLTVLTSNLAQLKGVLMGNLNDHFEIRVFLLTMLSLSILIQLITKTLVFMVYKAKIFSPANVPDDDDDDDDDEEEDIIRRRNAKVRKAMRLTAVANYLTFLTTIINIVVTTFALAY